MKGVLDSRMVLDVLCVIFSSSFVMKGCGDLGGGW